MSTSGAATGGDVEKTRGLPTYLIRSTGTVSRVAESPDSSTAVQDDGVLYEQDRVVTIVTSDVIDMVQQLGGAAGQVDYLGENILVEGFLYDDFLPENTFDIASPEGAGTDLVTLEVVEARSTSALELSQVGDDDAKKQSITSTLSLANGFCGWTARVVAAGRVQAGFKISKRPDPEDESEADESSGPSEKLKI